jgi:uncharacterized protein (DUF433 family)
VKRWSYSDLLALRLVDWLRHEKTRPDKPAVPLPKTTMRTIRRTLAAIERRGDRLNPCVKVWVGTGGQLLLEAGGYPSVPIGAGLEQTIAYREGLDLIDAWTHTEGIRGPNLDRPGPTLRLIPGKLSGEPHIEDTRVPTLMLGALAGRGLATPAIAALYPSLTTDNIVAAIALEVQLERNLRAAA